MTQVGGGLGIALLIGLYAVYVQFGFNDSKLALSVYYAATAVPFNTWLLKTYMDGIPVSYEEAAVVDGAPPWRGRHRGHPAAVGRRAGDGVHLHVPHRLDGVRRRPDAAGHGELHASGGPVRARLEYSIPWARFSAFALTFATPIMLVYLFAQRYIEGGLSFSGMEG